MGMREISLVPSITYGHTKGRRDFEIAAKILANTPELSRALITHRFPLDGAAEAFDVARTRSEGAIKVALDVQSVDLLSIVIQDRCIVTIHKEDNDKNVITAQIEHVSRGTQKDN